MLPYPIGLAIYALFAWVFELGDGLRYLRERNRPRALKAPAAAGLLALVPLSAVWLLVWVARGLAAK